MRKLASLFVTAILCSVLVFAQNRSVSGTVADANGKAIPFASITVKGTKNGVTADADGKFTIKNVASGTVLVITSVGFEDREVTVGSSESLAISLNPTTTGSLTEVVVTSAFGVKKSARVTPYSSQVINSEHLSVIRQTNLNNALAGKVAGVQFRGQSPIKLDQQGFLRIRGGGSLGDVEPLYVVDGTVVNSFDINPDDVEELNVLKGANATAQFGSRAANGAVVITTKKRVSKTGLGIEINQGITFDKVYIVPKYQNLYAGGDGDFITFNWNASMPVEWQPLNGKLHHDFTDDASWGPRMSGQEYIPWYAFIPGSQYSFKTASLNPQPDNARDFWSTGVTNNTNLNFGQGGKGYSYRVSYTNQNIKGMLPNSSSNRNTVFATVSGDLSEHFTVGLNGTFSSQKIKGEFDDGYANQSSGSFTQWFHRDLDMGILKELRGLRTPLGGIGSYPSWNLRRNPNSWNPANPAASVYAGNYWYNFYTYFDLVNNTLNRNRIFGDVSVTYKLNNSFRIKGTVRKNQLTTNKEYINPSILQNSAGQSGLLASYETGQTDYQEYNYELLASFNKAVMKGNLNITANGGGNKLSTQYKEVRFNTNGGLNIPNLYTISNSKNPATNYNYREQVKSNSLFAFGDFEYKKYVSLSWAIRNDWFSTLPTTDNSLASPSIGASFIFSEFTKSSLSWLSYGKVFGSWGKKPKTLDAYKLQLYYGLSQFLWNTSFLMNTPDNFPDPGLTGSLVNTWEGGVDLRFLKNRLGVNITYYSEKNIKEPLSIPQSGVGGFTTRTINAAEIERQGIEVELNAKPVAGKNFEWNLTTTFAYITDNTVVKLAEGVPSYTLSGGAFGTSFARAFHFEGKTWGILKGGGIARNAEGLPLITENGFSGGFGWYASDPSKEYGTIVPQITGGIQNFLNYKNFSLGMTLDYQFGGKFFSLSEMWGTFSGLLESTASINDKGKNVRDDVADGGGVHVVGVDAADGKTPVDVYVSAYDFYHQYYFQQIAEPFVHDLSFVKLREVSLGYRIPVNKLGRFGKAFQGANFSIIARNPWLIYRESDNFDPSEISFNHGEDGQMPGTRSLGFNLKLNF
jgi:TonB-linked SusC/RagA family outer membrane protein